jgi:hypothetical protein
VTSAPNSRRSGPPDAFLVGFAMVGRSVATACALVPQDIDFEATGIKMSGGRNPPLQVPTATIDPWRCA